MGSSKREVVLITGSGRSGTTWLGEMMRTNTACTYKYEPFPPYKPTPYHDWVERLESGDAAALADEFFAIASKGYLDIDRPPYTSDALRTPARPLELLYKVASRVPALASVFTRAARFATDDAPVLVKDVWIPNPYLPRLVEVLDPRIVTIIRHPYASVASALKGIDMGVFEGEIIEKRRRVRQLHAAFPAFVDPDGLMERLDELNATEIEALRWRLEAEPTAAFAQSIDGGYLVVYERLVRDPLGELTKIFSFLGWEVGPATTTFIEASQTVDTREGAARYYSTKRKPEEALEGWRKNISESQLEDITAVVASSPLLELWP